MNPKLNTQKFVFKKLNLKMKIWFFVIIVISISAVFWTHKKHEFQTLHADLIQPKEKDYSHKQELSMNRYCSYSTNDKLKDYKNESRMKGIEPQKNISQFDKFLKQKKLIRVPETTWCYFVRSTPNSYRFLTPSAHKLLIEICSEFMKRKSKTHLWRLRPTITSI
jgi:hypothetical protein